MTAIKHHIIHKEQCSIGNITLRSDKILMLKPFDDVTTCHIKDLEEMYTIFMDITKGVPHLYYSDNSNAKGIGSDEKAYIAQTFHHFAKACAIKENSAVIRFITHSFLYINRPQLPIKMFKTEEDAVNWLKSIDI